MSFVDVPDKPKVVPNFSGICPTCRTHLMFIHDLRCPICDNQTILWCKTCKVHKELKI